MCVNRHIFRNFLVKFKQFAAIFLCIPTFKPVTVRFRIIGRGDSSSMLHHFAGSLCLTAAVKAHSRVRLHLAPMCVNRHIFRNCLVEIKQFAAIFLCIPTLKLVTFRFWISGLFDRFFILHHFRHHFAGFLCLIAVIKAHSMGAIKVLRFSFSQQGIRGSNRAPKFIVRMRYILFHQFIPLFLCSRIMQFFQSCVFS